MARLINGRFPDGVTEGLKPVVVFPMAKLCVEVFSVVLIIWSIIRRCLIGVTIVDGVVSILIRFVVCICFCCARVFIVELFNGVLPVGKCGIPTRRAFVNGVRIFVLWSERFDATLGVAPTNCLDFNGVRPTFVPVDAFAASRSRSLALA